MPPDPAASDRLGCPKCRYAAGGCLQCRDPGYRDRRAARAGRPTALNGRPPGEKKRKRSRHDDDGEAPQADGSTAGSRARPPSHATSSHHLSLPAAPQGAAAAAAAAAAGAAGRPSQPAAAEALPPGLAPTDAAPPDFLQLLQQRMAALEEQQRAQSSSPLEEQQQRRQRRQRQRPGADGAAPHEAGRQPPSAASGGSAAAATAGPRPASSPGEACPAAAGGAPQPAAAAAAAAAATDAAGGGERRPPRKASPYAALLPGAHPGVPSDPRVPCWVPPTSPLGLLEEELWRDPWKLLLSCMLLNKTSSVQVRRVIWRLFELCPTPQAAVAADVAAIRDIIQPLGLFNKRAAAVQRLSHDYVHKQWRCPLELHGIGKYAADAYFMFCRGLWRDVRPEDKDLKDYHAWLTATDGLGTGLQAATELQEGVG